MEINTVSQLDKMIREYFQSCNNENRPPTVCGLALALGFENRLDLLRYKKKISYAKRIKKALLQIEEFAEAKLFDKSCMSGAKFSLQSNFKGWNEKSDNAGDALDKLDDVLKQLAVSASESDKQA